MTRTNLARLGGLTVVFGGLLAGTINTLNYVLILSTGRPLESFARGPLFVLLEFLGVAIALFLATGLTGLYALLGRRSRPGISGLVLAYLSVLASLSFIVFAIFYVSYQLLTDTDGSIRNPWIVFPENAVDLAGALLLGGGVLLLGAIAFKDRVLGRWSVLPLILGFLYLTLSMLPALVYLDWTGAPFVLFVGPLAILRAACWILLGGVLWAYASRKEAEDARSTPAG
ncbi:MAG: hypothetical protein H0T57_01185 [Rubrobacter sp.]|nr:hypothetical protein [Rubrobacter sp.]